MRLGVIFTVLFALIAIAYVNASHKLTAKTDLKALYLQMTVVELEAHFGSPFSRQRNALTYILEDSSKLMITLRDNLVASAVVKFHSPMKIEDPKIRQMTLVQLAPADDQNDDPSWFFASKPEEGLIYKITKNGEVESFIWVLSFTYASNQPKNLQALLRDFKKKHLSNL